MLKMGIMCLTIDFVIDFQIKMVATCSWTAAFHTSLYFYVCVTSLMHAQAESLVGIYRSNYIILLLY